MALQNTDDAVSLQSWRSAHDTFRLGRLDDARAHTARGLHLSRAGSALAVAHGTNAHALGVRSHPPYAGGRPSDDASSAGIFVREAALTGAYNVALAHARDGDLSAGLRSLSCIDPVLEQPPSPAVIATQGSSGLSQGTTPPAMRRLADAAAAALQLRAALMLLCGDADAAAGANQAAKMWLRAETMLVAGRSAQVDGQPPAAVARGAILDSLALAEAGDFPAAAATVEPHALRAASRNAAAEVREGNTNARGATPPVNRLQLAATYQCGALHALHSLHDGHIPSPFDEQDGSGELILLRSALAGFRAADAHALLGRIRRRPSDALRAFEASLGVDYLRPGTLAEAAVAFESAGRHRGQADIMSYLASLERPPPRAPRAGMLEVARAWTPDRDEVGIAQARALLLAGRPEDALSVLERVSGPRGRDSVAARAGALAAAAVGEPSDAAARAKRFADSFPRACSAQLAVADAALTNDEVPAAQAALELAVSVALREDVAQDRATAAARAAVRGVCFNNRAVLSLCADDDDRAADEMLAAAQVAFDKAAAAPGAPDDLRKWARRAADAASWNRVILFAEGGRAGDAASHWVGRRKRRGGRNDGKSEFAKPMSHVMGIVDEGSLKAMDAFAEGVEEAERTRVRLNEVVRETAERW